MILESTQPLLIRHSASDLTHFLACEALTALDLKALTDKGLAARKVELDESGALIAKKGVAHEKTYLQNLHNAGKQVVDIQAQPLATNEDRRIATENAMTSGVEVIYQATLIDGDLLGHADFLLRVETPSKFGAWSYEVVDTKLALRPQAKFLVQTAFYSEMLGLTQGARPKQMHLVLGDQSMRSFRCEDYAYYTQALLKRYRQALVALQISSQAGAYPLPCDHCDFCHWRAYCEAKRQEDDHLCQTAGIRKQQILKLEAANVRTMHALARLPAGQSIPKLRDDTLAILKRQARLQSNAKPDRKPDIELLPVEKGSLRGFERLPQPNPGDVYFDMEGDPLYPDGLEYLFGIWFKANADWEFKAFWAHDRSQERQAFEAFMTFVVQRRAAFPGMHIYHYAHYEEHALKRLSSLHGCCEVELDDLLRLGVLVDLYKVVKESVCISQPSYSIKYVESIYRNNQTRMGDVKTAGGSIVAYERFRESNDQTLLDEIQIYNHDDVHSTQQLHDWLLSLRPGDVEWFVKRSAQDTENDPDDESRPSKAAVREKLLDEKAKQLIQALPEEPSHWNEEEALRHLVAQMLRFYRRSEKPQWWNIFSKADLSDEELIDDPECLSGLTIDPSVPPQSRPGRKGKKTRLTFKVPPQDSKISDGDSATLIHNSKVSVSVSFDEANRRASFEVYDSDLPLPPIVHLGPAGPLKNETAEHSLLRFADALLEPERKLTAIESLLKREFPSIRGKSRGEPLVHEGEDPVQAAVNCALHLDRSYLYIQGPPGAGKTYTGARIIAALLASGRKVGVLSNSHKAINHLMEAAIRVAVAQGTKVKAVKKSSGPGDSSLDLPGFDVVNITDNNRVFGQGGNLIGGTAWLFPRFTEALDTLVVDEAGQVALANLVACAPSAKNIILLGDQMQLGQPIQGVHPGQSGDSTLDFLLAGTATIPPERGIFLPTTWRMHPKVCEFISKAVYESRLRPEPHNENRTLVLNSLAHPLLKSSGIHFVPVEHEGFSQRNEIEANLICDLVSSALKQHYTDVNALVHPMMLENILIVTPYNLQVKLLKSRLPEAKIGTVDKFQGQEAELVLVSMTTSSEDDLPRHVDFLYSKNRLNVAISRGKCTVLLLASPDLLAIKCSTPEEMVLVNTLCWLASVS